MKTVLVICESGYWRDLRENLAAVNCGFLGFDKKKPNRAEINQLVAKADFVVIRNLNVAHHSVRFAKEAAKASDTPFWIGNNFGAAKIIGKLQEQFPTENFTLPLKSDKPSKKAPSKANQTTIVKKSAPAIQPKNPPKMSKNRPKNLSLKNALKSVKIDDDEIDFEKMFKP